MTEIAVLFERQARWQKERKALSWPEKIRMAERVRASAERWRSAAAVREEPIHPLQAEGFRRMSPAAKLQMVCGLYAAGIRLRTAGLRMAHPDWTAEQLEREARRSLLHAGT